MKEEMKLDAAEAAVFAIFPLLLTAMLLLEIGIITPLLGKMDFATAAITAAVLTSIVTGIGYFIAKAAIRLLLNLYRRFKN